MTNYAKLLIANQSEPIFGREEGMTKNAAGGYVFKINPMTALERFLILGCEGGTYYVGDRGMAKGAAAIVLECGRKSPNLTVETILDISRNFRAIKPDPSIFALALLAGQTGSEFDTA